MTFHKPLLFMDYYRQAARHARAGGFATFHAHDLNTLPAAVLAARGGGRVVYDAHELYCEISTLSPREKRVWRVVERLLIRRADAVLTVCESIAGELSQRYSIRKPTIVLNCPPASAYPRRGDDGVLRRKAGLMQTDEPIVLYQGGLAPNRGLHELIHAARYLQRGVLVLMGSGRLRDELAALIGRLRLTGRVVMTDAVPQHELLSYTVGADVGVIPYRAIGLNNTYTTPNKLFEYLAAGLAVAGSRLPELRRVIDGHELGVTFDPDDPRDIGMALNFLLDPAAPLVEMRANARAAAEIYVWERQTDELLAVHPSAARSSLAVPARAI
jgi:glycosyltransferase involved in cell wall biosynthesis